MEVRFSLFLLNFYDMKALKTGLWLVWLCGVFMVCVCFYATELLPMKEMPTGIDFEGFKGPKITLFTAPGPSKGLAGERQALAVRSWLGLSESIDVVLFSKDASVSDFADSFSSRGIITALEKVSKDAANYNLSEQPSFYDTLRRTRAQQIRRSLMQGA